MLIDFHTPLAIQSKCCLGSNKHPVNTNLGSMNPSASFPSPSSDKAASDSPPNACQKCFNQKRKCDKQMPSCSRCLRTSSQCNYQTSPEFSSGVLLSTGSTVAGELFVPSEFPMHGVDIDRFTAGLVTATLTERGQPVEGVLEDYFTYIHTWLATIQEQRFRSRVRSLQHTPHAETALILLVMSLLTLKGHDAHSRDCARSSMYPLASYLFSLLQFARGPSLELVQAGLLLAVYETGSGRAPTAFITIGTCARLGYILRLNVDIPDPETIWAIAEERRRVWLGVYMIDRLIHQVTNITAHAVEDPANDYKLPINEEYWQDNTSQPQGTVQPSFSTPADIPQSYFTREIQASRILGEVQNLSTRQSESLHENMDRTDALLMHFMKHLLHQTPESWKVMCGANSIAMLTSLALHRKRITSISQQAHSPTRLIKQDQSILALTSTINMVRDTCIKFDARSQKEKLRILPLPATICVGEAARIAIWLNGGIVDGPPIDIQPLRRILVYSEAVWSLAGDYLRDLPATGNSASRMQSTTVNGAG
ncbi:Zn(II)2Cys6 transcription factor [Aspergillus puulaauensis]|uniref:Zn(2)-C6 fungal-type domain-containing protein n=1 Tax=Aspergillus puulaauensis TaxID=1220207 RepID=A0A7R7XL99_9EURO|nr:uncharacterized protein APUU_31700A [Aspergillus puulaauensis]BCS23475.1 hypothetical protein APUU_31700A [Aspergillus puulaauensis]